MVDARLSFLLVEDNDLDAERVERSFAKVGIDNPLVRAHDGIEALEILRGENGATRIEGPLVMLLDLNMPRMNGIELLEEMRSDKDFENTPVFVLTTSDRRADVDQAHHHNIAGYIVKPMSRKVVLEVLEKVAEFGAI